MAVNETIVTGRKYRRLIDVATKAWQRISFWTHAKDVEFDDGKTAQAKVGAIKGITTSTSVTETGYAADATVVKQMKSDFQAGVDTIYNACVNAGSTPTAKTPAAIASAINSNLKLQVLSNITRTGGNNLKSYFDISSLYYNYKSITIDNLIITINTFSVSGNSGFTWKYSYDASNGIITVDSQQTGLLCYPRVISVTIVK